MTPYDHRWQRLPAHYERAVAWRAARIPDPAARLRFLRSWTGVERPRRTDWRRRSALLLLGFLFIPPPTVSDANGTLRVATAKILEPADHFPNVWLVDQKPDYEVFSNGLRVETRFRVRYESRKHPVYAIASDSADPLEWRTAPAGIVYHTTESLQVPFEPDNNRKLKRVSENLLNLVRDKHSYHYVIDRFGRVWRVVEETDMANHAGYSVWATAREIYVNLNRAFLGVSFEAETGSPATPAQIHSARILTDMLRSRHRIPAANCVTHAQVSVNPSNKGIGYHTDWAADFPFQDIGLADNYRRPVPSLYLFGFGYDTSYLESTGARVKTGVLLAEERLKEDATARGLSVSAYRARLQQRYQKIVAGLRPVGGSEENDGNEERK
ncbi:MAG: peptidoglycan recognition family protein [Bryobacteraceae bacterium]|nr:peptidoglycan recognition family protein [Bryobacteraceae bacterium]